MTNRDKRWDALAGALHAYKEHAGISLAELSRRTGYNDTSLRALMRGEPRGDELSDTTARGIERVLGWPPGTVQAILDGSQPAPTAAAIRDTADTLEGLTARVAALEDQLVQLAQALPDAAATRTRRR